MNHWEKEEQGINLTVRLSATTPPGEGHPAEQITGFEPVLQAWKARVLAVEHYICKEPLLGIEPSSQVYKTCASPTML